MASVLDRRYLGRGPLLNPNDQVMAPPDPMMPTPRGRTTADGLTIDPVPPSMAQYNTQRVQGALESSPVPTSMSGFRAPGSPGAGPQTAGTPLGIPVQTTPRVIYGSEGGGDDGNTGGPGSDPGGGGATAGTTDCAPGKPLYDAIPPAAMATCIAAIQAGAVGGTKFETWKAGMNPGCQEDAKIRGILASPACQGTGGTGTPTGTTDPTGTTPTGTDPTGTGATDCAAGADMYARVPPASKGTCDAEIGRQGVGGGTFSSWTQGKNPGCQEDAKIRAILGGPACGGSGPPVGKCVSHESVWNRVPMHKKQACTDKIVVGEGLGGQTFQGWKDGSLCDQTQISAINTIIQSDVCSSAGSDIEIPEPPEAPEVPPFDGPDVYNPQFPGFEGPDVYTPNLPGFTGPEVYQPDLKKFEAPGVYDPNLPKSEDYEVDWEKLQNDPGYRFRMQQGQKGVRQNMIASGMGLSGDALKQMTAWSQGFASHEYDKADKRQQQKYRNDFQREMTKYGISKDSYDRAVQKYGLDTQNELQRYGVSADQFARALQSFGVNQQNEMLKYGVSADAFGRAVQTHGINRQSELDKYGVSKEGWNRSMQQYGVNRETTMGNFGMDMQRFQALLQGIQTRLGIDNQTFQQWLQVWLVGQLNLRSLLPN